MVRKPRPGSGTGPHSGGRRCCQAHPNGTLSEGARWSRPCPTRPPCRPAQWRGSPDRRARGPPLVCGLDFKPTLVAMNSRRRDNRGNRTRYPLVSGQLLYPNELDCHFPSTAPWVRIAGTLSPAWPPVPTSATGAYRAPGAASRDAIEKKMSPAGTTPASTKKPDRFPGRGLYYPAGGPSCRALREESADRLSPLA